jgi:GGDEF domain-containing protein
MGCAADFISRFPMGSSETAENRRAHPCFHRSDEIRNATQAMRTDEDSDFAPTRFEPYGDEGDGQPSPSGFMSSLLGRLGVVDSLPRRDPMTRLHTRTGLLERGERVLARRAAGQESALVLFEFGDLLEARGMYGMHVHDRALGRIVTGVQRLAGRHGLAARSGPVQFAALLPATTREGAIAAAYASFGRPCRIELEIGREELVLVPDVVVDTCAAVEGSVEELYLRLATTLARHRQHQIQKQSRMRRDRERHSRHFGASRPDSLPQSQPASLSG